jgi:hypothetical protein
LSPTSSPFCSGYFGDGNLENYLPRLALNHDPPDLSLPSGQDYRCEPSVPGYEDFKIRKYLMYKVENWGTGGMAQMVGVPAKQA